MALSPRGTDRGIAIVQPAVQAFGDRQVVLQGLIYLRNLALMLLVGGRLRLRLGTFHHQMHHRFFECNYGGLEIPWDKWMGSFHDGSAESYRQFLQQRKLKAQRAGG
jgi:sterol desaturase/sphingolipid hydroxylase (fatty acid hydroxylase superfamily)